LFTVRNLVSASGGHLGLESAAVTGARIVLSLPQFQDETASLEDSSVPPPTILLVEDDDAIRILLSNSLEAKGYRVLEARDGEEALVQATLCDDPIQLLITDVVMPRMDGAALARRLTETRPSTKILLISGCATDLAAIQHLLDGGAHYLQKPFTQSALLEWIEANLQEKPAPPKEPVSIPESGEAVD
jgi:DNA-binding response OmpR family regulator